MNVQVTRFDLEKLTKQFQLTSDPNTRAITCFFIATSYRDQGFATTLVCEVMKDLRARCVSEISELWNEPESMFLRVGLTCTR